MMNRRERTKSEIPREFSGNLSQFEMPNERKNSHIFDVNTEHQGELTLPVKGQRTKSSKVRNIKASFKKVKTSQASVDGPLTNRVKAKGE